jgi:hypothetical protein
MILGTGQAVNKAIELMMTEPTSAVLVRDEKGAVCSIFTEHDV